MEFRGLRDDVYRRPLATALDRLGIGPGWTCVDVGAGGGDVSVALAEIVGREGRVYAVDSDPTARDEVAEAAAAHSQVLAITQSGEDLRLPEAVDLAFCRFLLLHVVDPSVVLARMAASVRPGGWVVAQEPITSAGRIGGEPFSMPSARHPDGGGGRPPRARGPGGGVVPQDPIPSAVATGVEPFSMPSARHPDVGALLPSLARDAGLITVDAWAEAPAGAGPGPVADYL